MDTEKIVKRLLAARRAYYSGAKPIMSDAAYDLLEDQLREIDLDHSFFRGIGFSTSDGFAEARHQSPMTSLNKVQTYPELQAWWNSVFNRGHIVGGAVVSAKCDGISVSLTYQDGNLVQGATRGDGQVGEDITRNVVKMKNVKTRIDGFNGRIRGEIVLRKSDWKRYFPNYSNPRNAASGIAKRLDGTGSEYLTVLHYQLIDDMCPFAFKEDEFAELVDALGIDAVPWHCTVATVSQVNDIYNKFIAHTRDELDYDIDGLVVEMGNLDRATSLGLRDHRPEGARAFKFPHDTGITTLRDVEKQVGVTGRVAPVAIFDTINLAGADISRASLSNYILIKELGGLRIGDQILISRRNDVIPHVESVVLQGDGPSIEQPELCPCCGSALEEDGRYLSCINDDCPAQVAGAIRRWCSRLDLKGWGPALIGALCEQGLIQDASDLYTLDPDVLATVEMDGRRVGDTAFMVMSELRTKAEVTLDILVGSMGIKGCGRSVTRMLMEAGYDTLDKLSAATLSQLELVNGLGPSRAYEFRNGLVEKRPIIDRLLARGVRLKVKSSGSLNGKTVCMTGFRDKELTAAIEQAGGTVKDGVGRGLTYLVAKDKFSTSGKNKKALEIGSRILDIDEMWAIINSHGSM